MFDRDEKIIRKHINNMFSEEEVNSVLKQYILKGYAVNDNRIKQLGEVIRIMKRTQGELDSNLRKRSWDLE